MVEVTNDDFRQLKKRTFKINNECKDYVDMISSIIAPENQDDQPKGGDQSSSKSFLKIGSLQ